MLASDPVGLPGLAAMMTGFALFLVALLIARLRKSETGESGATRSRRSWLGVMTQGFGICIAAVGPIVVGLDPTSAKALIEAAAVAVMMAGAVGLFVWATATMGRNWSLVARTRSDHSLVTTGPFAWVRHPIYTSMALILFSVAIAFGHVWHVPIALAIFARGTWLRIRDEERLLGEAFGVQYDGYAARVKRFVPGMF